MFYVREETEEKTCDYCHKEKATKVLVFNDGVELHACPSCAVGGA